MSDENILEIINADDIYYNAVFKIDNSLNNFDICFHNPNYPEMLKLCENGDIYVKGKLIENDIEVVDGMREFLGYINKK